MPQEINQEKRIEAFVEDARRLTTIDAILCVFLALYREVGQPIQGSRGALNRAIVFMFNHIQQLDKVHFPVAIKLPGEIVVFSNGDVAKSSDINWQRTRIDEAQILDRTKITS